MDTDVLIAGAGLTGSVLALLLGRAGLSCTLVDPAGAATADPAGPDPRALTLTQASRRILQAADAWRQLPFERIGRFQHMEVWDQGGPGQVRFDCADVGASELGFVVEQFLLQAALDRITDVHPGLTMLRGRRISELNCEDGAATLDDGRRLTAALLVAADGIHSPTRQLAQIDYRRHDYRQRAVACVVRTERPHDRTARQRFLHTGPLAFLPLAEPRTSGIVWSTTPEQAQELLALPADSFHRALAEAFEYRLGAVQESGPRADFPLARAQAGHYSRGRLALVGDAAHCIHPLAGQGANLGFLDAAALAEVAAAARARRRDIGGRAVLRRYQRWRRGENYLMMMVMEGFKLLFENRSTPVRLLRNLGLNGFDSIAPLKHTIMRRAMGLEGDLPAVARRGD